MQYCDIITIQCYNAVGNKHVNTLILSVRFFRNISGGGGGGGVDETGLKL